MDDEPTEGTAAAALLVSDAGSTGTTSPDDVRLAAAERRAAHENHTFVSHVKRADVIATATVGEPIDDVVGEYPNGEVDSMQRVPMVLGTILKGAARSSSVSGDLNFARRKLAPGEVVLVFLRGTPSGGLFILDTVPLKDGVLTDQMIQRVQGALQ